MVIVIRVKVLPDGWCVKASETHQDNAGTIKTKHPYKDKGKSLKSQNFGSFEAILEQTEQGTYRIKEVINI